MRLVYDGDVAYFQFPSLSVHKQIWHGVFTRNVLGGYGFNLGLNGVEPNNHTWDNRQRALSTTGAQYSIFAKQVHGVQVGIWDAADTGRQMSGDHYVQLSGDALVSNVSGAALFIQTADCQSVIMIDPVQGVIANVHSGWRGSIANIIGHTVDTMVDHFHCRPDNIHCGIGPSLGPCCAEFIHYRQEIPEHYWKYRYRGHLFNFWQLSVDQLAEKGIPRDQVEIGGICTRCNQHLFYSYRGEGSRAGRFAAAVALN